MQLVMSSTWLNSCIGHSMHIEKNMEVEEVPLQLVHVLAKREKKTNIRHL